MPKRGKRQEKTYENEGRPPELTLASFLQFPDLQTSSANISEKNPKSCAEAANLNSSEQETLTEENTCGLDEKYVERLGNMQASSALPSYFVSKTKKGKLPLQCENRSKGKKVTIISNVTGDVSALLHELKKRAGCGGVIRDGNVELQGDRIIFVSKFLNANSCLKPYHSG